MQPEELKGFRKFMRLTQGEFAAMLGLSQGYIGELERGEKPLDGRTLIEVNRLILAKRGYDQLLEWRRLDERAIEMMESGETRYHHNNVDVTEQMIRDARSRIASNSQVIADYEARCGFKPPEQ
jgi:transcriptional regulator with XRE-family HTH domain